MHLEIALTLGLLLAVYASAGFGAAALVRTLPAISRELQVDAKQRQLSLDGLRGLLALNVVCHHGVVTYHFLEHGRWEAPLTRFATELGQGSVALFFMITSFLFWGRLLAVGPRLRWGQFYLARVFRLVPLYLAMVALVVVAVLVETHGQLVERKLALARELTNWVFFTVRSAPPLNGFSSTWMIPAGVTWSLRYEWAFYLALPLFGYIFTRARQLRWAAGSLVMLAVYFKVARSQPFLAEIGCAFIGGIVAAYWIRAEKARALASRPIFGGVALVAGAVVFFACPQAYALIPLGLLTVLFIAIVSDNPVFALLRAPAVRWLGEVSYGIYLFHGIFLWATTRWIAPHWIDSSNLGRGEMVILAVPVAFLLVVATSLLNLLVERPGIELGRRLAKRDWKVLLRFGKPAALPGQNAV